MCDYGIMLLIDLASMFELINFWIKLDNFNPSLALTWRLIGNIALVLVPFEDIIKAINICKFFVQNHLLKSRSCLLTAYRSRVKLQFC